MFGLKKNVVLLKDQYLFSHKKHQIPVLAGLLINDINECLVICQKQDGTIFHVMAP